MQHNWRFITPKKKSWRIISILPILFMVLRVLTQMLNFSLNKNRRLSRKMFQMIWNQLYPRDQIGPWYEISEALEERRVNPITGLDDPNGSLYWFKK